MNLENLAQIRSLADLLWDEEAEDWRPESLWDTLLKDAGPDLKKDVIEHVRSCQSEDGRAWSSDAFADSSDDPLPDPKTIGEYVVDGCIGEGGMGIVYKAHREGEDGIRLPVAIKLIKLGMDTKELIRRFRVERVLLARLNHPNIVAIRDLGSTPEGKPFLVMELVESGLSLTAHCAELRLPLRARLELFRKVCGAVQYAHQHLIVHRDLKPTNILVDAHGEPKLLDFGLASLMEVTDSDPKFLKDKSTLRQEGPTIYISAELRAGLPYTTATDIYSLGAVLRELVEEPVDFDLQLIIQKALQKEPNERFGSAAEFSEVLRKFIEAEPVPLRKLTMAYNVRKFAKRHRKLVTASVSLLLLVSSALGYSQWQLQKERTISRQRAESRQRQLSELRHFAENPPMGPFEGLRQTFNFHGPSEKIEGFIRALALEGDAKAKVVLAVAYIQGRDAILKPGNQQPAEHQTSGSDKKVAGAVPSADRLSAEDLEDEEWLQPRRDAILKEALDEAFSQEKAEEGAR